MLASSEGSRKVEGRKNINKASNNIMSRLDPEVADKLEKH